MHIPHIPEPLLEQDRHDREWRQHPPLGMVLIEHVLELLEQKSQFVVQSDGRLPEVDVVADEVHQPLAEASDGMQKHTDALNMSIAEFQHQANQVQQDALRLLVTHGLLGEHPHAF